LTSKKLRVGVVGIGKMGLLHASTLNAIPEVELAAFCDRSLLIRRFLKKVFREVVIVKRVLIGLLRLTLTLSM
jgi:predicted dehydrogenase